MTLCKLEVPKSLTPNLYMLRVLSTESPVSVRHHVCDTLYPPRAAVTQRLLVRQTVIHGPRVWKPTLGRGQWQAPKRKDSFQSGSLFRSPREDREGVPCARAMSSFLVFALPWRDTSLRGSAPQPHPLPWGRRQRLLWHLSLLSSTTSCSVHWGYCGGPAFHLCLFQG